MHCIPRSISNSHHHNWQWIVAIQCKGSTMNNLKPYVQKSNLYRADDKYSFQPCINNGINSCFLLLAHPSHAHSNVSSYLCQFVEWLLQIFSVSYVSHIDLIPFIYYLSTFYYFCIKWLLILSYPFGYTCNWQSFQMTHIQS